MLSAQGTTVTFGGSSLGKVLGVNGSFSTGAKVIRPLADCIAQDTGQYLPTLEQTECDQTVDIEVLAGGFSLGTVGATGSLFVGNDSWNFSFGSALCESIKVSAKVADFVRLTYSFKRSYS